MVSQRLALVHLGLDHGISTTDRGSPAPPAGHEK
jgi:hypothetical protein